MMIEARHARVCVCVCVCDNRGRFELKTRMFAKFSFDKFSCDFIFGRAASSENISSSKKIRVKRERGGDECALIKIRARTMAAAA